MADVNWTVTGTVLVNDLLTPNQTAYSTEPTGTNAEVRPLIGVNIIVYGATVKGAWNKWGSTSTDENGAFSYTRSRSDKPHFIKVEVALKDDSELEISHYVYSPNAKGGGRHLVPASFTIFKSEEKIENFVVPIGECLFADGEPEALGSSEAITCATTWYAAKTVIKTLTDKGTEYGFKKLIKVHFGARQGNAVGHTIGVTKDAILITLIHEMMHVWNYDHNKGTSDWVCAWIRGFSVHNKREWPSISFHEGFAEYSAFELANEIWGSGKALPSHRSQLYQNLGLSSFEDVERSDTGVLHGLRLLTAKNPSSLLLGSHLQEPIASFAAEDFSHTECPSCQLMDFWDVLTVFLPNAEAGCPDFWEVSKKKNGLKAFMERATKIIPTFDSDACEFLIQLLGVTGGGEPWQQCQRLDSCVKKMELQKLNLNIKSPKRK